MPRTSDPPTDHESSAIAEKPPRISFRMSVINAVVICVSLCLAILTLFFISQILSAHSDSTEANVAYGSCESAVGELQEASDYLTSEARQYVYTGRREHLDNYLAELLAADRRGRAVAVLREQASNVEAIAALEEAMARSDKLAQTELYAMRLTAEARNLNDMPATLEKVEILKEDQALSAAQKQALASKMLHDDEYTQQKLSIGEQVQTCTMRLMESLRQRLSKSNEKLNAFLGGMYASVILLLAMVVTVIATSSLLVLRPMRHHAKSIRNDVPLVPRGAHELRYLAEAYNDMFEANRQRTMLLRQEAHSDPLTCLLNRGAYESLISQPMGDIALLLIDVDYFKRFNDEYGHDMGDAVLMEVAGTLLASFRSSDHVCRIGGDEFAVIMTNVSSDHRDMVRSKIVTVSEYLRDTSNGLPSVTISVGVAFADTVEKSDELFRSADEALYEAKRRGRDCYVVYDFFDEP